MNASRSAPTPAFEILRPPTPLGPVVFASPHSGRVYAPEFLAMSRLDAHALRQSEDGYVDLLFDAAPAAGAPLIRALFPRAYVDVNRARDELDPEMFMGPLARPADRASPRVRAGLGVIPRLVADGHRIYGRRLSPLEAERRLRACYDPYHAALRGLLDEARRRFGVAVLIDCHSMPSAGGAPLRAAEPPIDMVLGDRYGAACCEELTAQVEGRLTAMGYRVSRNAPYAGGHVAKAYGRPGAGVHVLQIEINRALYIDERRLTRHSGFATLQARLRSLIEDLISTPASVFSTAMAAE